MSPSALGRVCSALAALTPLIACSSAASSKALHRVSWGPPPLGRDARVAQSREAWRAARDRLAELQREASTPRTLRISLVLREPMTGRTLEARGAVAIAPPSALRMILLGPGGTTALDLWLDRDRFRFAVPAIDLLRRGDASTPRASLRGLPIDFLRWWLLRPATGALLWAAEEDGASRLRLRDGAAIIDLRAAFGGRIEARRTTWAKALPEAPLRLIDEETVASDRIGCAEVRYQQASTGLEVTVRCEGEDLSPPNPRAFSDPDGGAP